MPERCLSVCVLRTPRCRRLSVRLSPVSMRRLAHVLPLLLTGCASVGVGETPWVLPGGRVRVGAQTTVGRAEDIPSAIVDGGALRAEVGAGRGVEVGALLGADLGGIAGGGASVKVRLPARRPVAVFIGGSVERTSFGVYQSAHRVRGSTVFGGMSAGGQALARPPRGYAALFPYATARLAWVDAREVGYIGESDADAYDVRYRGFTPGVAVGVTMRETVGLSAEVGVQRWKGRTVPVVGVRLRL